MSVRNTISQADYEKRVIATSSLPDLEARAIQLDARIDYLLGTDFPADRRVGLQKISEKMNGHFFLFLIGSVLNSKLPLNSENISEAMAKKLIKRYENVLTEDEIHVFFKDSLPAPPKKSSPKI